MFRFHLTLTIYLSIYANRGESITLQTEIPPRAFIGKLTKEAFQVFVCCFAWLHLFLLRIYFDMSTRTLFEEHVLQLSDARMQTRNHAK